MDSFRAPCEGRAAASKRTLTLAAFVSGSKIKNVQGGKFIVLPAFDCRGRGPSAIGPSSIREKP
jgi:hypothetical protein